MYSFFFFFLSGGATLKLQQQPDDRPESAQTFLNMSGTEQTKTLMGH